MSHTHTDTHKTALPSRPVCQCYWLTCLRPGVGILLWHKQTIVQHSSLSHLRQWAGNRGLTADSKRLCFPLFQSVHATAPIGQHTPGKWWVGRRQREKQIAASPDDFHAKQSRHYKLRENGFSELSPCPFSLSGGLSILCLTGLYQMVEFWLCSDLTCSVIAVCFYWFDL